jgi:hypothetical protein
MRKKLIYYRRIIMNKLEVYVIGVLCGIVLACVLAQPFGMVMNEIEAYMDYKEEQQNTSAIERFLVDLQEEAGFELTIKK